MAELTKEKLSVGVERQQVPQELSTVESPRKSENIEAMSWMEKLERRFGRSPKQAPGDVQDDTTQVSDPTQGAQQPPVTVPVTAKQANDKTIKDPELSLTWLVLWAQRRLKQLLKQDRKVLFAPDENSNK
jgi:hypothetical protein